MEETSIIKEITVIKEGFLAMTPFRYTLEEWQLTKAGRKAKKAEMKRLKKMKKDKAARQQISNEQQEETRDDQATLDEDDNDSFVADFCSGLIEDAIYELNKEEKINTFVTEFCNWLIERAAYELSAGSHCETVGNVNNIPDFEVDIKAKIDSLEKGEGDIGRKPTPVDLFWEKDAGKLEGAEQHTSDRHMSGDADVEPAQSTEISLDGEEPDKTGHNSLATDDPRKMIDEKNVKKIAVKGAKGEKKRQEKERKERKRIEEEQIKATKKYLKMVDEALKDRTKVFKLFWEKIVEEQRRQDKSKEKEQRRERKAQNAEEKKKLKEGKSKLVGENGNNNHMTAASNQDGGAKITEQLPKKRTTFGSRVLRFLDGLFGELVF